MFGGDVEREKIEDRWGKHFLGRERVVVYVDAEWDDKLNASMRSQLMFWVLELVVG